MRSSRTLSMCALLGATLLASCSSVAGDGADSAATPAKRTAAAVTTTPVDPPTTTADSNASTPPATSSTSSAGFADEVLPIIEQNCASCHTGNGAGSSHLAMDNVSQLTAGAEMIGNAVSGRYMPPWPASDAGLDFHGKRSLSDEQIQAVVDWVSNGGKADLPPDTPVVATGVSAPSVEPDVTMTGVPYQGSLDLVDDYRCQIYDPALTDTSYLQGVEFIGDQRRVVHHALIFSSSADTRQAAEFSDAADGSVGWRCDGFVSFGTGNTTLVNSWAPGQGPLTFPADTGFEMGAGDFFVVQIHYHYEQSTVDLPPDESRLIVDFADNDVIAAAGGTIDPLQLSLYLPPAEIPCSPGVEGPLCDRATAAVAKFGAGIDPSDFPAGTDFAALAINGLDESLKACGMSSDDVAAMTDGTAWSRCTLPAAPGKIVSLWGHMHSLGATFRMTLNPGTPEERVLLDIPRWDYAWQLLYFPTEDVTLKQGDQLLVECSWDRSLDDHGAEPRYIFWAEGTYDEMCYSQVVTRPAD